MHRFTREQRDEIRAKLVMLSGDLGQSYDPTKHTSIYVLAKLANILGTVETAMDVRWNESSLNECEKD